MTVVCSAQNKLYRKILSRTVLRHCKHARVFSCHSTEMEYQLIVKYDPDIVIAEIATASAIEDEVFLAKVARENRPDAKIIYVSSVREELHRAALAGAAPYIWVQKPFIWLHLSKTLRDIVKGA